MNNHYLYLNTTHFSRNKNGMLERSHGADLHLEATRANVKKIDIGFGVTTTLKTGRPSYEISVSGLQRDKLHFSRTKLTLPDGQIICTHSRQETPSFLVRFITKLLGHTHQAQESTVNTPQFLHPNAYECFDYNDCHYEIASLNRREKKQYSKNAYQILYANHDIIAYIEGKGSWEGGAGLMKSQDAYTKLVFLDKESYINHQLAGILCMCTSAEHWATMDD